MLHCREVDPNHSIRNGDGKLHRNGNMYDDTRSLPSENLYDYIAESPDFTYQQVRVRIRVVSERNRAISYGILWIHPLNALSS